MKKKTSPRFWTKRTKTIKECFRDWSGISQQKYITDLLAETGKVVCKSFSTLMDSYHKLCKAEEESVVKKCLKDRLEK